MYGLLSGERTLLRKQAKRTKRAAFADGTHKNFLAQWRTFLQFCQYIKCQPLPVSAEDLCLFAQFLARSFKSVDSIRNYISGVRTLHSLLRLTCGANDSLELKLLLKALGDYSHIKGDRQLLCLPHYWLEYSICWTWTTPCTPLCGRWFWSVASLYWGNLI